MKLIKFSIIALILTVSSQLVKAQVSVGIGVNLGTPVRRVYVERPYPVYETYPRTVYYEQPVVYRSYRPVYRTRYYERPVYRRQVVYREHFYRGHGRGHGRRW
ncbi:hypothetical protein FFF34_008745 [Inquilinus sp. KBS0705]|nr:hypothetical protein FFF34_008745 [Inquilinus sp. KBS0705]